MPVSNTGDPLCSARIWRHHNGTLKKKDYSCTFFFVDNSPFSATYLPVCNVLFDPLHHCRFCIQVVHWDVKETLQILTCKLV